MACELVPLCWDELRGALGPIRASLVAQLVRIHLQRRRPRFDPWVGKIPWRRKRQPTPVFLGFPCGSDGKESACNVGDLGTSPGLGRSPGEGNGYPLQYSGLENSMDYTVCGVTSSWTRLSDFHFPFQSHHLPSSQLVFAMMVEDIYDQAWPQGHSSPKELMPRGKDSLGASDRKPGPNGPKLKRVCLAHVMGKASGGPALAGCFLPQCSLRASWSSGKWSLLTAQSTRHSLWMVTEAGGRMLWSLQLWVEMTLARSPAGRENDISQRRRRRC